MPVAPSSRQEIAMRSALLLRLGLVSVVAAVAGAGAAAQVPAPQQSVTGGHKHYTPPEKDVPNQAGQLAPRLQNVGKYVFPTSTKNARAQLFMNQGVNLSYAFNHAESGRAFREAARLDPTLAMAYWGQALVLGPNINAAMEAADEAPAYAAIQKAMSMKDIATPREQAFITALAQRYSGKPEDRAGRDRAYADAMRDVYKKFPSDLDAAVLYVESVMDLRPWGYWMNDGAPYEGVAEAVAIIEKVMARRPDHPGALHLYIHLMEAHAPKKAEAAADKLLPLAPAAGHLVHMPAHIYQRVGRYADAMKSNQLAIAADEDYITQCRAQGLYPIGYYPHNLHFLWFAATADGQSAVAIEAARKAASKVDADTLKQLPLLAAFKVVPYFALTRFGRWEEMLREPAPPADNAYLYGVYHYARGLALVATSRLAEAEQELAIVRKALTEKSMEGPLFSPNTAGSVFAIAPEMLAGEIAMARKQYDTAIAHFERGVRLEDSLVYTEPSEWHYPPRHALGAALLEAGRPREAETVYWEDLRRFPENGWALIGVVQALRAQNKNEQAAIVEARLTKAWARADVKLTGSRFK
jgi:tetratricopeptide (TPR) repeat protein